MLDYEWGNSPAMMIPGGEQESAMDSDHSTRQIIDHYASQTTFFDPENSLITSQNAIFSHHVSLQQAAQSHIRSLYDHRTDLTASDLTPHSLLSLDPVIGADAGAGCGFLLVPKSEEVSRPPPAMEFASRIGLNLGWRTYFSSEDDFINRLYRHSRPAESGLANSTRCQAEGCDADLSHSKHYHRRHKVCEFHSKASTVIAAGLTQRFCQQCSRFHLLAEFDNGKRSCRKRLADHNRRRRKNHQSNQASQKSQQQIPASSDNPIRSPTDSGAQSSSSVTVATSPRRRMPFDSFRQRSCPGVTSSASSSSILFSNG